MVLTLDICSDDEQSKLMFAQSCPPKHRNILCHTRFGQQIHPTLTAGLIPLPLALVLALNKRWMHVPDLTSYWWLLLWIIEIFFKRGHAHIKITHFYLQQRLQCQILVITRILFFTVAASRDEQRCQRDLDFPGGAGGGAVWSNRLMPACVKDM